MTDHTTIRLVVIFHGLVALAGVGMVGLLAYQAKPVPDALTNRSFEWRPVGCGSPSGPHTQRATGPTARQRRKQGL